MINWINRNKSVWSWVYLQKSVNKSYVFNIYVKTGFGIK